jgi:hypothetical protein
MAISSATETGFGPINLGSAPAIKITIQQINRYFGRLKTGIITEAKLTKAVLN